MYKLFVIIILYIKRIIFFFLFYFYFLIIYELFFIIKMVCALCAVGLCCKHTSKDFTKARIWLWNCAELHIYMY